MLDLISAYNEQNHFGKENNLTFEVIEPGKIEYKMQLDDKHFALPNVVHGGAISGFMDAILSVAAFSLVAKDQLHVATIEFKINYLEAVRRKMVLKGIGEVIRRGKKLIFTEGKIYNDDNQLVATGSGTIISFSGNT